MSYTNREYLKDNEKAFKRGDFVFSIFRIKDKDITMINFSEEISQLVIVSESNLKEIGINFLRQVKNKEELIKAQEILNKLILNFDTNDFNSCIMSFKKPECKPVKE